MKHLTDESSHGAIDHSYYAPNRREHQMTGSMQIAERDISFTGKTALQKTVIYHRSAYRLSTLESWAMDTMLLCYGGTRSSRKTTTTVTSGTNTMLSSCVRWKTYILTWCPKWIDLVYGYLQHTDIILTLSLITSLKSI